jgi:hypothetical protein
LRFQVRHCHNQTLLPSPSFSWFQLWLIKFKLWLIAFKLISNTVSCVFFQQINNSSNWKVLAPLIKMVSLLKSAYQNRLKLAVFYK